MSNTNQPSDAELAEAKPRELFEAVGDLALAILPRHIDTDQRGKVRKALTVLVDHIIAVGERRAALSRPTASQPAPDVVEALKEAHRWILNDDADRFGPTETRFWNALLDRIEAALSALPPADERAKVVAWLRARPGNEVNVDDAKWLADAIEKGQHHG